MSHTFSPCDLVLVEGFKHEAIPKLEVYRPGQRQAAAVATAAAHRRCRLGRASQSLALPAHLARLDLNDVRSDRPLSSSITLQLGEKTHAVL
jgi:molybdopterin-guanine dinucleotide biosynthesis protein